MKQHESSEPLVTTNLYDWIWIQQIWNACNGLQCLIFCDQVIVNLQRLRDVKNLVKLQHDGILSFLAISHQITFFSVR